MSRFRDDYATARRTLEDLVREEMASDAYADTALHALALLHFGHGQYALAIEIAQRLVASRRDGGGRLLGAFLDTLAALQIIEGSSVDDALRNARESLRLSFAEGGLSRTSRDPLGVIALAYAYIGDYERAAELGSFADGFLQGREREFERAVFGRLHAVLAQALVPHELSEYRSRGARLDHEAAMQLAFFPTDGVASVEKTGE